MIPLREEWLELCRKLRLMGASEITLDVTRFKHVTNTSQNEDVGSTGIQNALKSILSDLAKPVD